jgi:hypothetical protein
VPSHLGRRNTEFGNRSPAIARCHKGRGPAVDRLGRLFPITAFNPMSRPGASEVRRARRPRSVSSLCLLACQYRYHAMTFSPDLDCPPRDILSVNFRRKRPVLCSEKVSISFDLKRHSNSLPSL